jgi:CHAD domain-containing protein
VYLGRDLPDPEREETVARREKAYDEVVKAMNSSRFRILLIDLVGWLALGEWKARAVSQKPICAYAGKRLDKIWGTIEPTGRTLARMDEECRHELRIQVKKMRYAVEFFDQLYPATARKKMFVSAIEGLQEGLGKLNDLVTARSLIQAQNTEWWRDQSEEVDYLREAEGFLKRLSRAGPFWREVTSASK